MQIFSIKNKEEMARFARDFAVHKDLQIIGLKGELGAGKSFFAKHFIESLKQQDGKEILSPTFNLVYSYQTRKGEIFHFDLYRLKSFAELENIGFFDACKNSICLIEWPQIAEKFLKKLPQGKYIELEIKISAEEEREIFVS